jgi:5-methylcytosine-specific restriction protein A
VLVDAVLPSSKSIEREDDETDFEDLTKIRIHKRIERNQRLAKKVKAKKGLVCEACGFSYGLAYKNLDTDYIEAHHLVAFAELTGSKVPLDPEKDFAVLCADCHRMIHRSEFIHDIKAFRLNHIKPKPQTN